MTKIKEILDIVLPFLTAVTGWAVGTQKNRVELVKLRAEADGNVIQNAERVLKYYKTIIDDLESRLADARKQITSLEKELNNLKTKINENDNSSGEPDTL